MFKYLNQRRKRGQSTLEYAVLIIIIIGALLSIQIYIKRGIQGRLKSATDDIGQQFSVDNTLVNNIRYTNATEDISASQTSGSRTQLTGAGELTLENMVLSVRNTQYEYWGN